MPPRGHVLFLCFLKHHVPAELLAILFEFYLTVNKLLVLTSPVHLSGVFADEFYELLLRHNVQNYTLSPYSVQGL